MDKLEAFDVLKDFVIGSGDEKALQAMRVLVAVDEPLPPQPLGALWNEAAALTKLVRVTGEKGGWVTPRPRSRDMERLLHRFVCLLETFTVVLADELPVKPAGHVVAATSYLNLVTHDPEGE